MSSALPVAADPHDPIFLQSVRKAHCSRKGSEHTCVGTCTIKPDRIVLDCALCGQAEDEVAPPLSAWAFVVAREVLEAAGMDVMALSPERQLACARAAAALRCPGCHAVHVPKADERLGSIYCPCGGYSFEVFRRMWVRR